MNRIPELQCQIYSHITSVDDIRELAKLDKQSYNLVLKCIQYIDLYPRQELPFSLVVKMINLREINTFVHARTFEEAAHLLSKPSLTRAYVKVSNDYVLGDVVKFFADTCDHIRKFLFLYLLFDDGEYKTIVMLKEGFTMVHFNYFDDVNTPAAKELLTQIDKCLPIVELQTSPVALLNVPTYRVLSNLSAVSIAIPFGFPVKNFNLLIANLAQVMYYTRILLIRFAIEDDHMNFETLESISTIFMNSIISTTKRITKPNPKPIYVEIPIQHVENLTELMRILPNLKSLQLLAANNDHLSSFLYDLPDNLDHITLFVLDEIPKDLVKEFEKRVKKVKIVQVSKSNTQVARPVTKNVQTCLRSYVM